MKNDDDLSRRSFIVAVCLAYDALPRSGLGILNWFLFVVFIILNTIITFFFISFPPCSFVLGTQSYNLLQDRMRAAMATADAVTEAIDYKNPTWVAAAGAAAAAAAGSTAASTASPGNVAALASSFSPRPASAALASNAKEEVAIALASVAANRKGKGSINEDYSDDFSRLMQVLRDGKMRNFA